MSVAVQSIQSLPGPFDIHHTTNEEPLSNGDRSHNDVSSSTRQWKIPASAWQALRHPRADSVSREVNAYFIQHWPFPNSKAERKFVNAGFPNVTCLYFPLAKDDRIHFACRLLTVLFLIDGSYCNTAPALNQSTNISWPDVLEEMSFAEGEAYNEHLIPIMRGTTMPDRVHLPST